MSTISEDINLFRKTQSAKGNGNVLEHMFSEYVSLFWCTEPILKIL